MKRVIFRLATAISTVLMCAVVPGAQAADDVWPSKPLTIIVPFPPGGVADTVARPVAQALAKELNQSVIVENKAGVGGGLGIAHAARAKPDGYTLLMSLSSMTTIPEADKVLERAPMFQLTQLKPIARFTADPTVLVVRADSPWKTVTEFVAALRAKPGAYSYGSSGNYGTMHVPMEMLKSEARVSMLHIPYTGAGPALVDLLGGRLDAVATGPSTVAQYIKTGKLRALAHWGPGVLQSMPTVPSMKQSGIPIEYAQWCGLFAPAGTPEPGMWGVVVGMTASGLAVARRRNMRQA